ncbi:MAG: hypothetical protein H5U36_07320 [Candidatus Caldatribacterium sp.]|nr:hypothetical protein [Candidatus Caldatribacterium sp.]
MKRAVLVAFAILVALACLLPFTLLSEVPRFSGSFLFWNGFAGASIALLYTAMRSWHE